MSKQWRICGHAGVSDGVPFCSISSVATHAGWLADGYRQGEKLGLWHKSVRMDGTARIVTRLGSTGYGRDGEGGAESGRPEPSCRRAGVPPGPRRAELRLGIYLLSSLLLSSLELSDAKVYEP